MFVNVVEEGTTHTKELETNKKKKSPDENTPITWKHNVPPHSLDTVLNCLFDGEVSFQFDESASAFDICEQVINLDVLAELLSQQSNLYSQQNGRNFLTNAKGMKAFIGVNYIMAVNWLPSMPMYLDCDHFLGNVGIQNIFTRTRFQKDLGNRHFADNTKQGKTDKGF